MLQFSRVPEPHFDYLSPSFECITGIPVATVTADFHAFAAGLDHTGRAVLAAVVTDRSFQPHLDLSFQRADGFKSVNDTPGHDAGDAVLRATAARLQTAVRDADVVARHGSDEFVVVYEGADDDVVRSLVERIHNALSAPIDVGGGVSVRCGASVGIADTRTTAPLLVARATSAGSRSRSLRSPQHWDAGDPAKILLRAVSR